ncbi:uncharacterized protein LOC111697590 [Eurytemora carolleeae]|uniref:uncharacterized protein LOC111697590 n=1 Tax=Eurytemora carolleeae TaxID=1294199 RepID=UPI000C76DD6D|nr:uncharacterized protein LOC111697590 [Eurytemora carolleeae]XP_023323412.1 uncharacterized protein LOC111697590 [Eurytemora carolleeae]|eukprot:XP_023323411.1 uncharacterized protein LOC111697590 [Eurytemora affinis]
MVFLSQRSKNQVLAGLLIFASIYLISHLSYTYIDDEVISPVFNKQLVETSVLETLNSIEITGDQLPRIKPFACVRSGPFTFKQVKFIMCVKPFEVDTYISRSIYNSGSWEKAMVELVLNLLAKYQNITLLDVGSNIGMFTVAAAAANFKVVAVDPFKTNLAYARLSTMLEGTESNVRFIAHTVSDEKIKLYPWNQAPNNEGGISFLSEADSQTKPKHEIGEGVDSIRFNEILEILETDTAILKIDIEGAECKALLSFLQSETKLKHIPYILMEWVGIRRNVNGMCPNLEEIIKGFTASGYQPANMNLQKLGLETEATWNDVLWVHQDAK